MVLSQSSTENPGAVHGLVAERLAAADAERMKRLDRLIAAGKGNVPQTEEDDMAERKPKACCGSLGQRHKAGCKEAGKLAPANRMEALREAKERVAAAAKKVARERPAEQAGLDEMEISELVQLKKRIDDELLRRQGNLEEQLAELRKALAEAA